MKITATRQHRHRTTTKNTDEHEGERANWSCPNCGTSDMFVVGFEQIECYDCGTEITETNDPTDVGEAAGA